MFSEFVQTMPLHAGIPFNTLTAGVNDLNSYMRDSKKDCASMASLKVMSTQPPMTAEQHTALKRKRRELRMKVEAAKELKAEAGRNAW
jgi:hypothetical protein